MIFGKKERKRTPLGVKLMLGAVGTAGIVLGIRAGGRMIAEKSRRIFSGLRRAMKRKKTAVETID